MITCILWFRIHLHTPITGCRESWANSSQQMRRYSSSAQSRSSSWSWKSLTFSHWQNIFMKTNYSQATDNDSLKPGENKLWGRGVVSLFFHDAFRLLCSAKNIFVIKKKSPTSTSNVSGCIHVQHNQLRRVSSLWAQWAQLHWWAQERTGKSTATLCSL